MINRKEPAMSLPDDSTIVIRGIEPAESLDLARLFVERCRERADRLVEDAELGTKQQEVLA
jgi:hypothetical protein